MITLYALVSTESIHSDPWDEDEKEVAKQQEAERREAEATQRSLQRALEDWAKLLGPLFKEKLETETENGKKSAPPISVILTELRNEVKQNCPSQSPDSFGVRLLQEQLSTLDGIEAALEDWVPVYKWAGPEGERDE